MENNFEKFNDVMFGRYGVTPKAQTSNIYGDGCSLTLSLEFYHHTIFKQFLDEMCRTQETIDEEKIRKKNPAVQRAYEEYQLLLKLSQ